MAPDHEGNEDQARELLRAASHDLRSPLAVIQLLVRRAEQRQQASLPSSDGELLATLSRIDRVASHALTLIEDVLSAERLTPSQASPVVPGAAIDVEDVSG